MNQSDYERIRTQTNAHVDAAIESSADDGQDMADLQQRFDALNASHAEVCATLEAARARGTELEKELDGARKIINTHCRAIVASIAVGVGSEQANHD